MLKSKPGRDAATQESGDAETKKARTPSLLRSLRRVAASPRRRVLFITCCLLFATGCRMDMQDQPRFEVYESSTFFKDGLSSRPLVEGTVPRGYLKADREFYTGKIDRAQTNGATMNEQNANARAASNNAAAPSTPSNTLDQASANASGGNVTQTSATKGTTAQGDPNDVTTFPFPVTEEIVNRGQERFRIYCAMCHGETGYGDGMIVRRGFRKPPSYHTDELRNARVGHFFDVITNGWGSMPSYNAQIPAADRWAIIAYIRALQKSQEGVVAAHAPAQTGAEAPNTGGPK